MFQNNALNPNNGLIAKDVTDGNPLLTRPNYPSMKKSANYRDPVVFDKKDQPNAELGLLKQKV